MQSAFGQVIFSCLEINRNRRGPNLENRVDETTIRSVIRSVLPWRLRTNELVRYHGERALFFSLNEAVFSSIQRRIGPINQHSTVPWLAFPSPNNRWKWCRIPKNGGHNLSGRWNRFCLLWSKFAEFSPLFRLFFRFWCVMVDPCQQWRNAAEILSDCA